MAIALACLLVLVASALLLVSHLSGSGAAPSLAGSGAQASLGGRSAAPLQHAPTAAPLKLPGVLPASSVQMPVLMYHRIDRQTPRLSLLTRTLTVTPTAFAAQMEWLVAHGFHAIRQQQLFDALYRHARLPPRPVLITFDDGYRDVFKNALPVLERLHLVATAYVITSRISGPDPSFLTWSQVTTLSRHGVEIGSHTVTHRPLTRLAASELGTELTASRRVLERRLARPVQWFAYPYGDYDAATIVAAREAGYVLAVTTKGGFRQDARQPLALHRYEVRGQDSVSGFAALLSASLSRQ